ncbi:hypothetical protein Tsubulata_014598 [Turnera subulata]|uniref:Uncharacterized protein n=1 Tax=Turnera subulata TaxID=218843 RepID=A0A9Q0GBH2_9ROSI|nr:hypothetical protein Tsubulata_014598 [Turnera subulata]
MLSTTKPFMITSRRPFTPAGGRLHATHSPSPTFGATATLPSSRRILPARAQNISSFSPAFRSSTWRLQCIAPPQGKEEEDEEERGKEEEEEDSGKEEHKEGEEGVEESSELQLGFIKKVYLILAAQLLATAAVSAPLMLEHSLVQFIFSFPHWFLPVLGIFVPSFCDPSILRALLFSSFIVDHTDRRIIRPSDADPMLASLHLYMDILTLFLNILQILQKLR